MTEPRVEKIRDWRANDRPGKPRARQPDRSRDVLQAWLDYFGRNQPRDWSATRVDGCWPDQCSCGMVDLIERTRCALR